MTKFDPFQVTPAGYDAKEYTPQYPGVKTPKPESESPRYISPQKRIFFWFLAIFFVLGFTLTLSEVLLRIIPGQWTNSFFHQYDPDLGTWHIPSHSGDYVTGDFETRGIEINSFGMRDRERSIEKTPGVTRIAVLGDSFTEAFHVDNDKTYAQVMEKSLGTSVEVLNFGVAGFGTVQELLAYEKNVRQWKPDIVVLGFLAANDMRNNSRVLEDLYTGTYNTDRPFPRLNGKGEWEITPPTPKPSANNPVVLFAKRHFTTYRFLWHSKGQLMAQFQNILPSPRQISTTTEQVATSSVKNPEHTQAYLARLFAPPTEEPFTSAWGATEWAIKQLDTKVTKDGGRLVVVTLPDVLKMEPNAKQTLEEEYQTAFPDNFDINYPETRLRAFTGREGILFLDLTQEFRRVRDQEKLKSPYFSYEHDGHWGPSGHQVAGSAIAEYLKRMGLSK